MFRNNYDGDTVTFSPKGRVFQVEYACEAVKQGSPVVAIAGKDYVVLSALKRNAEELSSYQKKTKGVSDHVGVGFAGLSSDARRMSLYLEQEAAGYYQTFGRQIPVPELVYKMASVLQGMTQTYGTRPVGAGFLVCGYDSGTGTPHLFEIQPSAHYTSMSCAGIGARSQMARTYFEKNMEDITTADKEGLIRHVVLALRESVAQDKDLAPENTTIAIVGKDHPFTIFEDDEIVEWLKYQVEAESEDEPVDEDEGAAAEGEDAQPAVAAAGEQMEVDE